MVTPDVGVVVRTGKESKDPDKDAKLDRSGHSRSGAEDGGVGRALAPDEQERVDALLQ